MLRQALALLLIAAPLAHPAISAGENSSSSVAATATQIMLFNLTPAGSYQVRRNGVVSGVSVASPPGGIVYPTSTDPGDRYEFLLTGLDPVEPARPAGFVARGNSQGCVVASWTPPASTDYVTNYSLLWGRSAGAYTDSVRIDAVDIAKGAAWVATHCGFASGSYVFALRAHNSFDRWSPLSAPSSTTIGNEDTQGPAPPTNVRVSENPPGCAALTWTRSGDATIVGYRVFFGNRPRSQVAYTDSIEAGNASAANRCGLAAGNYYFAVRAYTATGVMSAYSTEVMLAALGADVTPPSITQRTPAAGATGVPVNALVYFVASDDRTGVDPASISVQINGVSQPFTTSTITGGVAVQCDPVQNFAPNTDIEVDISVADRATPPNETTRTWSFRTGTSSVSDGEAPELVAVSPAPGAEGVDPRPTIEIRIRDAGLGVDFASFVFEVNGSAVTFTIEGTPSDARIRYRPASNLAPESSVDVHVDACDLAAAANCAALDFNFTVGAALAAAEGAGAIVPDGYWAHDPARPLEIRNLPSHWCVRIFDASGATVRRHENTAEGANWSWNFRNDQGGRVAPALYLVRVTDPNGAVKRSGRFLVQSQQ